MLCYRDMCIGSSSCIKMRVTFGVATVWKLFSQLIAVQGSVFFRQIAAHANMTSFKYELF